REAAFAIDHTRLDRRRLLFVALLGALLGAPLAIQNVGAGHIVRAGAHQRKFDLILDILDVEGPAGRLISQQRPDNGHSQRLDLLANSRRGGALTAAHRDEGLAHRDHDLVRLEPDYGPVAPDHLVFGQRGGARPLQAYVRSIVVGRGWRAYDGSHCPRLGGKLHVQFSLRDAPAAGAIRFGCSSGGRTTSRGNRSAAAGPRACACSAQREERNGAAVTPTIYCGPTPNSYKLLWGDLMG